MKNTAFLTLALGLLLSVFSCTKEGTIYQMADGEQCLSFPAQKAIVNLSADDGGKFTAELWRGNTSGAASVGVNIVIDDDDQDIIIPEKQTFDFAAGESRAYITFTYDYDAFEFNDTHNIEIELMDLDQVSPSGKEAITIAVTKPLTYVEMGTVNFTYSDFWGEPLTATLYKANEIPGYYSIRNCYEDGYDLTFTVNGTTVTFPDQPVAYYGDGYGPYAMLNCSATLDGNVIDLIYELALPEYEYSFGYGFEEIFELPEGWNK